MANIWAQTSTRLKTVQIRSRFSETLRCALTLSSLPMSRPQDYRCKPTADNIVRENLPNPSSEAVCCLRLQLSTFMGGHDILWSSFMVQLRLVCTAVFERNPASDRVGMFFSWCCGVLYFPLFLRTRFSFFSGGKIDRSIWWVLPFDTVT